MSQGKKVRQHWQRVGDIVLQVHSFQSPLYKPLIAILPPFSDVGMSKKLTNFEFGFQMILPDVKNDKEAWHSLAFQYLQK